MDETSAQNNIQNSKQVPVQKPLDDNIKSAVPSASPQEERVEQTTPGKGEVEKKESPQEVSQEPKVQIPSPLDPLPTQKDDKGRKTISVLGVMLFVVIFFILTVGTVLALIAYEIIPMKNEEVKNAITDIVMKVPFLPKTKSYIFKSMAEAHKNLKSVYLDASFATSAAGLQDVIGMTDFDMSVKGPIDLRDEENMKMSLNINVTNQLDMELRVLDNFLYFKVNTLPTLIKSFFGVTSGEAFDDLLGVWVQQDISPFESEARDTLDEFKETEETPEKPEITVFREFVRDEIVPKFTQTTEEVDGFKTYKLSVRMEGEEIKDLYRKLGEELQQVYDEMSESEKRDSLNGTDFSTYDFDLDDVDVVESLSINLWVDKKDYYMRKTSIIVRLDGEALSKSTSSMGGSEVLPMVLGDSTTTEPVDLTFVIKFSDFGSNFGIVAPEEYVDIESWVEDLLSAFGMGYLLDMGSQAKHQQFMMDHYNVKISILLKWIENNTPPETYADLEEYSSVPPDEYIGFTKVPNEEVVVIYGYDPLSDDPLKPILMTVIDDKSEESEEYYSEAEANELLKGYGIEEIDWSMYSPLSVEVPEDVSTTPIPTVPEEKESDTPFGRFLN
ncbi:hypothetical protein JXA34_02570 [Patescibacteria group bacterium]|nr:hypothetical protein [Patescibacteria group bacterium]